MKTAIITGACGAIGKAITEGLAKAGYEVIMVGRKPDILKRTAEAVSRSSGNKNVVEGLVDLSLKNNILNFAQRIKSPVHVLVNNACTAPRQRAENADGTEMQWAVNVLAYFHMMTAFLPHLTQANGARIINVASYWAGGLDLKDPEFKLRRYDNDMAYRQSKQAGRMLTAYFAESFAHQKITVNACHPGDVNSKLSNSLGFGGSESPTEGADTPVWLATSTQVEGISGKYFEHRRLAHCGFMAKKNDVRKLYELCSIY